MDTSAGHICQCCGGIKTEEAETIAVKSELVEIKKELNDDLKPMTEIRGESNAENTQNIDCGDIENEINVSLDEKVKTEESDIDTKSWQLTAEKPEGSVKPEENEDKQNSVCNTCGGIVVKTETDPDTKLMIPALGTSHITPTSKDFSLEVGIDNSKVNLSTKQGADGAIKNTGVAVNEISPVMQDQVEPIVIQPECMMSGHGCHQEQPDQQTCTASESNATDAENNVETFKISINYAATGEVKARDAGKNTASLVAQEVGPTRKSLRILKRKGRVQN